MTFKQALVSLARRDRIGDAWLKKPFTIQERKKRLSKISDYLSKYWLTESKGAYGAVRCLCGELTKRKYPWFRLKECIHQEII